MSGNSNFKNNSFKCPICSVVAQQKWFDSGVAGEHTHHIISQIYFDYRVSIDDYDQKIIAEFLTSIQGSFIASLQRYFPPHIAISTCGSCNKSSIWLSEKMIYPKNISISAPNDDFEDDIKELYYEAGSILSDSPKGATALLRLALQKLLLQVGKSGRNINNDIKELVAEGLSPKIQQGLDLLRVVGNNAVHPGQIDFDDNSDIALKLFKILNFIADELITKPKELKSLYTEIIPEDTQRHIEQRDNS